MKKVIIFVIILLIAGAGIYYVTGFKVKESMVGEKIRDLSGNERYFRTPAERVVMVRSRDIYEFSSVLGDEFPKKIIAWGPDIETSDKDAFRKYSEKFPEIKNIPFIGSIFKDELSPENIISYDPDLIIMETFMIDRKYKSVDRLEQAGLPIVYLSTSQKPFEDPQESIRIMGKLFEKEKRAEEIAGFIDSELAMVNSRLAKINKEAPAVYIECGSMGSKEYGNTYGKGEDGRYSSWGAMLEYAHGKNIMESSLSDLNVINPEFLLSSDPDIIIITGAYWPAVEDSMRLGYYADKEESRRILDEFLSRPGWSELKAVKNKKVYAIHHGMAMHIFNFIALEQMVKWLYPEEFADLDPEARFRELHDKFLPVDYSGVWMMDLYEEK